MCTRAFIVVSKGSMGKAGSAGLGLASLKSFQQALGRRGCPLVVCIWSRVIRAGR